MKGFGWEMFCQAWSKDGKPYTIEFLADKLKDIIRKSRKMEIPNEPPIDIPKRKSLPILGMQKEDVKKLDFKFIQDAGKFKKDAQNIRMKREESGLGSMHSEMQSRVVPKVDDLFVGKRIDVLYSFDILDGHEREKGLRWCQGEVIKIIPGKQKPRVEVLWDAIPELNQDQHTSVQILPESKWNKHIEGAWRMDIDMIDDYCEDES